MVPQPDVERRCSCKSEDVILITIETCDKKLCENLKKKIGTNKSSTSGGTRPTTLKCTCGRTSCNADAPKAPPPPAEPAQLPIITNPKPSPEIIVPETKVEEVTKPPPELRTRSSPSLLAKPPSAVKTPLPAQLQLPQLPKRHHGPGCAMEISVLERHEDACYYKKTYNENRDEMEDRVGSYECVGRLVYKTCNVQPPAAPPQPAAPANIDAATVLRLLVDPQNGPKCHYPGDTCKLHMPSTLRQHMQRIQNFTEPKKIPAVVRTASITQLLCKSPKRFPGYEETHPTIHRLTAKPSAVPMKSVSTLTDLAVKAEQNPSRLRNILRRFSRKVIRRKSTNLLDNLLI